MAQRIGSVLSLSKNDRCANALALFDIASFTIFKSPRAPNPIDRAEVFADSDRHMQKPCTISASVVASTTASTGRGTFPRARRVGTPWEDERGSPGSPVAHSPSAEEKLEKLAGCPTGQVSGAGQEDQRWRRAVKRTCEADAGRVLDTKHY